MLLVEEYTLDHVSDLPFINQRSFKRIRGRGPFSGMSLNGCLQGRDCGVSLTKRPNRCPFFGRGTGIGPNFGMLLLTGDLEVLRIRTMVFWGL